MSAPDDDLVDQDPFPDAEPAQQAEEGWDDGLVTIDAGEPGSAQRELAAAIMDTDPRDLDGVDGVGFYSDSVEGPLDLTGALADNTAANAPDNNQGIDW